MTILGATISTAASSPATGAREPYSAIVVGTGFAGIGMGISLRKHGVTDFLILEKKQDVGGVWRDNTYPGAACDVPSHLYSFSFELRPHWSHAFAPQREILDYLRHCTRKYDLLRHIRFSSEVCEAAFDEREALWTVKLSDGTSLKSRMFIVGTGQLSRPAYPRIEGLESFQGKAFHSATWDHNYPLAGKRVAVIGTGASAIQFVPAIADQVKSLTVFQRSAPYVLPRPDCTYSKTWQGLLAKIPGMMHLWRCLIYLEHESRFFAFRRRKWLMHWTVGAPFRSLLNRQVPDSDLRARMMPDYPIGCKRILLSSEYLSTFSKPHVKLVTEGIQRVVPEGIETVDHQRHEVDAIIYGTGFAATEFLAPMKIRGIGGVELNQVWRDGAKAYLGMTVPRFPNFFMLYGPNTNLGHNSIVFMLESQIEHIIRCMKHMQQKGGQSIDVDEQVYEHFNKKIQGQLSSTVWKGCKTWYFDREGRSTTNWPGFTVTYRWLTKRSDLNAYHVTRAEGGEGGA